jgi:hypothetical protein
MKTARKLAILVVLLVVAFVLWDLAQPSRYRRLAATIRVGDDKARVQAVMGSPTGITTSSGGLVGYLFGIPAEAWYYGRSLEWRTPFTSEFPWVTSPVTPMVRIFEPRNGDMAIHFGSSGKVTRIEIAP